MAGNFGFWELLVLLLIVLLLFGTRRLRNLGTDLGTAVRGFRGALRDGDKKPAAEPAEPEGGKVIEGEAVRERDKV